MDVPPMNSEEQQPPKLLRTDAEEEVNAEAELLDAMLAQEAAPPPELPEPSPEETMSLISNAAASDTFTDEPVEQQAAFRVPGRPLMKWLDNLRPQKKKRTGDVITEKEGTDPDKEQGQEQEQEQGGLPPMPEGVQPTMSEGDMLLRTRVGETVPPDRNAYRNFSLRYIDTDQDVLSTLNLVSEGYGLHGSAPPRKSHAETIAEADAERDVVDDLKMILQSDPDLGLWNRKQLLRARQVMTMGAEELYEYTKEIVIVGPDGSVAFNPATFTGEKKIEVLKMLNAQAAIQFAVQGQVKEIARALNSMKIPASADPVVASIRRTEMAENIDDKALLGKLKLIMEAEGNVKAVNEIAQKSLAWQTWDMVMEYWINSILFGISTQGVNIMSNLAVPIWNVVENTAAATIKYPRSGIQKLLAKNGDEVPIDDGMSYYEVFSQAYGMLSGYFDAFAALGKTWSRSDQGSLIDPEYVKMEHARRPNFTGAYWQNMYEAVTRQDAPGMLRPGGAFYSFLDGMGRNYVRLPGRFLTTMDDFFKIISYSGELHRLAAHDTMQRAKNGDFAVGSDDFRQAFTAYLSDPPPQAHLDSLEAARINTFTNEIGGQMGELNRWINKTPGLRPIIPFVRTPTNIAKYALNRTPLPLVLDYTPLVKENSQTYKMLHEGGEKADMALARLGLGTGAAISIFMLMNHQTEDGTRLPMITGAGPVDPDRRRQWKNDTDWQPYSILINGKYYSYNRFDPFGMWLGMVATSFEIYNDTYEDRAANNVATAILFGLADTLSNKTYLKSVGDLLMVLRGEKDPTYMLNSFLSGFVPNYLATIERQTGEIQRTRRTRPDIKDPDESKMDKATRYFARLNKDISTKNPLWSSDIPPDVNWRGEDLSKFKQIGAWDVPPLFYTKGKDEPDTALLIAHDVSVNDPYTEDSSWSVGGDEAGAAEVGEKLVYDALMDDPTGWKFYRYRQRLGIEAVKAVKQAQKSDTWIGSYQMDDQLGREVRRSLLQAEVFQARRRARAWYVKKYKDDVKAFIRERGIEPKTPGSGIVPPHMTPPGM